MLNFWLSYYKNIVFIGLEAYFKYYNHLKAKNICIKNLQNLI